MQQLFQQLIPATPTPPHFRVWLYWEADQTERTDTSVKSKAQRSRSRERVIFELHPFPESFHQAAA